MCFMENFIFNKDKYFEKYKRDNTIFLNCVGVVSGVCLFSLSMRRLLQNI